LKIDTILNRYNTRIDTKNIDKVSIPQVSKTPLMETTIKKKGEVDSKSRVHGVAGIRVADASVLPVPIAAHYMVCVYALGWKIADLIADSCNEFQGCDVVFDSL